MAAPLRKRDGGVKSRDGDTLRHRDGGAPRGVVMAVPLRKRGCDTA
jgi:hypothetical protein